LAAQLRYVNPPLLKGARTLGGFESGGLIGRTTMNDLDKEISELKQIVIDRKADRSATKEEEQREGWTK
jgi:hypothetical protein